MASIQDCEANRIELGLKRSLRLEQRSYLRLSVVAAL